MERIAKFEKVSFEQFYKDTVKELASNGVHVTNKEKFEKIIREDLYSNVKLPTRATGGSSGNDFVCPSDYDIAPGESVKILTGIRVKIDDGWFLAAYPRSSLGFKYRIKLDNTVGIIDSDYYYADNEGHIALKMTNEGREYIHIKAGDRIAQGIFQPYGITVDDDAGERRSGGFGSTGR